MQASDLYSILPPGFRYRELWLPELINNHATLPSLVSRGHGLTLTGARKGTTCEGVHFDGSVTSNINCGAIHDAAAKLWISLRFKLDQTFDATSPAAKCIWAKRADGNNYMYIDLLNGTGKLAFVKITGGALSFSLQTTQTSWIAGQWYHVIASISNPAGARLRIDNGTALTDVDVSAVPNGGVFYQGGDPALLLPIIGTISDFFCGTDDLTTAEEADLYNGIPPVDATEVYLLDEGRGVTAVNRGSSGAGANGTLDTACTWAWGQVKQPVLSVDAINDRTESGALVDIKGNLTYVWVGKMKSTYSGLSNAWIARQFSSIQNSVADYISFQYDQSSDVIRWLVRANPGAAAIASLAALKPSIDDYWIAIGTGTVGGVATVFLNGYQGGSGSSGLVISGLKGTASLGNLGAGNYDVSKPLMAALIEGAFTDRHALAYTKSLVKRFDLPIAV